MNVVSFTSDFGLQDSYVGVVKGVMLRINPLLQIVDLSHDIKPFAVEQAAYILSSSYRFFPVGAVHLAVVDPGVGTDRAPLILRRKNCFFVGPDNGIFTDILNDKRTETYAINRVAVAEISDTKAGVSMTFDGRDLFGPAAALLSKGVDIGKITEPLKQNPVLLPPAVVNGKGDQLVRIIHIDHFGNIITALQCGHLKGKMRLGSIKIGNILINQISKNYQEVSEGHFLALWGSTGYLEISINQGNAAKELKCVPIRDMVEVQIK